MNSIESRICSGASIYFDVRQIEVVKCKVVHTPDKGGGAELGVEY